MSISNKNTHTQADVHLKSETSPLIGRLFFVSLANKKKLN